MAETTGIMDAQTLHSLLGLHGGGDSWQKKKKDLIADLVIVDESSMMDMWLAWQLFQRLRPGTKLLLVGDADQLESVGSGRCVPRIDRQRHRPCHSAGRDIPSG